MSPYEVGIVLLSALIHAVWSVFIKGSRSPLAFNVVQALPLALLFLPLLYLCRADLPRLGPGLWLSLAGTGFTHALYLYWLSLAYERADLTLVYPIARSTPAFLPLAAIPLLGESISPLGGLGIATVVAGMWTVQLGGRPAPGRGRGGARALLAPGMAYAWLTLATTVVYSLIDKHVMGELAALPWSSPVPRPLFGFFAIWLGCATFFVPLATSRLEPGMLRGVVAGEWKKAALAGVISAAGYGLILAALQTAEASYVVAVRQASVLFVLVLSVRLLREQPGRIRLVGALATVAGVALIALAGPKHG